MNTHESIRSALPLAAAGALGQEELLKIEKHTRECPECRAEWDVWLIYAAGLRQLPQPIASADLIARTQAQILRQRSAMAESRWNGFTLSLLGLFSWFVTGAFWMLARTLAGGRFEVFGMNLVSAGPWFLFSFASAAVSAAAAAFLLGSRSGLRRML